MSRYLTVFYFIHEAALLLARYKIGGSRNTLYIEFLIVIDIDEKEYWRLKGMIKNVYAVDITFSIFFCFSFRKNSFHFQIKFPQCCQSMSDMMRVAYKHSVSRKQQ